MEQFLKLKALINTAETDARKFYERGNKLAGVRLRKALQLSKMIAQNVRKEVSLRKKA